ncbi:FAD binding domain-containing protein [Nemania serpens]|nr:FAD binding domain-containing protein [Nemania serpens]
MRHCSHLLLVYFVLGVGLAFSCMVYFRAIHTDFDYFDLKTTTTTTTPTTTTTTATITTITTATTTTGPPSTNTMSSKPVIVVGSGLAGLSAAYEALQAGANRVHMLERASKPGGNSIKASSGINGADTRFQRERGIRNDSRSVFLEDSVRSAGKRLYSRGKGEGSVVVKEAERRVLLEMLTARSADAVEWLADEIGVDLSVVAQLGGHSVARTHRGASGPPPGAAIVGALVKKLSASGSSGSDSAGAGPRFTLSTEAEVKALVVSETNRDGAVAVEGVRYVVAGDGKEETHELRGPVVFATGGFAGDAHGLLARHRPDLAGMPSTNDARPASHGLLSGDAGVGAAFVDMDSVQIHPTGFVDPKDPKAAYKFLAAEALRGEGGILLSPEGRRFVNEMERRDVASAAVMALPRDSDIRKDGNGDGNGKGDGVRQWNVTLLLDPGACEAAASHLGFYVFKGLMRKVKVRDLPPAVIEAVDRYAAAVAAGRDDEFGRKTFGAWRLVPGEANRGEEVAVGTVTPVTHFTMGGVAFNERAEVLGWKKGGEEKREGEGEGEKGEVAPVKGLWAAGEITGGLHGDNRLGGSSLLECVVFGRIAGREAAASLV